MADLDVTLGQGGDDMVVVHVPAGEGACLKVTICRAAEDGVPYLIIDTDNDAKIRIDLNDARLALVDAGGHVSLPAHWREFDIDESE